MGRIGLIQVLVITLIVTPLIFIYSDQAVNTGCYGDPLDCLAAFGSPFFVPNKNTPRDKVRSGASSGMDNERLIIVATGYQDME